MTSLKIEKLKPRVLNPNSSSRNTKIFEKTLKKKNKWVKEKRKKRNSNSDALTIELNITNKARIRAKKISLQVLIKTIYQKTSIDLSNFYIND